MHSSALVVAAALLAPAPHAARVDVGHRISLRVPAGWHVVRRPVSDVTEPAVVLAVSTGGVRVTASRCECGTPDVHAFGRGAFVYAWEYMERYGAKALRRTPRRPARFHVTANRVPWSLCSGPSWGDGFRNGQRVLDVEVYLGPRAGRRVRAQVDALLDSLRLAPLRSGDYFHPEPVVSRGSVRILDREHSL
jgi:hypothetical protein